jgi:hypothetical protein
MVQTTLFYLAFTRKDKAIHCHSLLESGADPATRSRVTSPVPVDPEPPAFVLRTFGYNLESKFTPGTSAPGQPLREKAV